MSNVLIFTKPLAALYMSHTKTPLYNLADTLNWKYDYATEMRALLLSIGCVNGAKDFSLNV